MTKTEDGEKLKHAITEEKRHINETLRILIETKSKTRPTKNDQVAMAVYAHNLYMGMENILRRILQFQGVKITKTDSWHKELLKASIQSGVVPEDMYDTMKEYMSFRHRVVHGYGYMLEPEKMRFLIDNAEPTVLKLFSELKKSGYL